MARRIEGPPNWRKPPRFMTGIGGRHPWERWMDGNAWEIEKGEDYDCTTASMGNQLRRRAKEARLKAIVEERRTTAPETIMFQYLIGVRAGETEESAA